METYKKRVAFVISDQHFIPHGGIGSFCKSFFEMAEELSWRVDIILDKNPRKSVLKTYFKEKGVLLYYPEKPLSYADHNSTFIFTDGVNIEKTLNFQHGMMKALEHHVYDMIIINTPEAGLGVYFLNLQDKAPLIYYTHNEHLVFFPVPDSKVFNKSYNEFARRLMTLDGVITGTQSTRNRDAIKEKYPRARVESLPMRIPELKLLEDSSTKKNGVMFIGRYESRKNPEFFLKVIKETGLKAKVLTNKKGAEKFEKKFKELGIKDYEIKAGIIGDEKVDFIKSAKLGFHPAKLESYGFSAFETLHSCPTYALIEYQWWTNFEGLIRTTTKVDAAKDILKAYNEEVDFEKQMKQMKAIHKSIAEDWQKVMDEFEVERSKTLSECTDLIKTLKEKGQVELTSYYKKDLNCKKVAIDDVESVMNKRGEIYVHHTASKTFISLYDVFEEPSTDEGGLGELFAAA